ncbi:glycosyltransferase involved in cell wall biosynthesis [Catalinimonas alkaloidigena]|uniref:glycosyltransferase family 4 protein n=1 Tax=Catalinimonas alkaloidigena TaxID=1075417 RepID=UPI002405B986|nr:glycosyltransferase family 4 protein [Catalinimonas alkaloidigena]MDF9798350.1 glycosyltransferase involved in cell wall biosynthesis [Catalinimonas alkaloidigena]
METKLAILTTHPIQYYAPVFRMLAASPAVNIKIFYTRGAQEESFDKGFGRQVKWDIPLLEGYDYLFLKNSSKDPGTHHFRGIVNPYLINEVTAWGANALLVFGWSNRSHLKALRYFKGKIPVYFRGDSHLLDEHRGIKQSLRRALLKWVYRHIDYAFYVGTESKKYFLKHGLNEEQMIFAPHAIDNSRFADLENKYEKEARQWRQKLEIKADQKVILFCGKFENKKNPLLLLQVAKQMQHRADLIFLFVGNGHLEEQMKAAAQDMKNIRFLDFQNQSCMPVVYRLGDVFALPSQGPGETWGLAVNEAMACSRPVLVSNKVGCASDLVKPGKNGYIFESNSLTDITNKLKLIIENKDSMSEMGGKSLLLIQDWSFKRIVEAINKQLSNL